MAPKDLYVSAHSAESGSLQPWFARYCVMGGMRGYLSTQIGQYTERNATSQAWGKWGCPFFDPIWRNHECELTHSPIPNQSLTHFRQRVSYPPFRLCPSIWRSPSIIFGNLRYVVRHLYCWLICDTSTRWKYLSILRMIVMPLVCAPWWVKLLCFIQHQPNLWCSWPWWLEPRSKSKESLCLRHSAEFTIRFKDLHMRGGERQVRLVWEGNQCYARSANHSIQVYNKLNEHESIRFPVKKAETSADKAFLLIQVIRHGMKYYPANPTRRRFSEEFL